MKGLLLAFLALALSHSAVRSNTPALSELLGRPFQVETEIDLTKPGLAKALACFEAGNKQECRNELAAYFLNNTPAVELDAWESYADAVERADAFLRDDFRLGAYETYRLPENISWGANPSESRNWNLYLCSFDFLTSVNEAYRLTHDARYLEKTKQILIDFVTDNYNPIQVPSEFSWYDHSVALRTVYLIDFWKHYVSWGDNDILFAKYFIDLMWRQALFLASEENYSEKSNHGIFSDSALLRLAISFPEFRKSAEWKRLAIERIERQVRDNFSNEGVHLEYSPSYHVLVADLLVRFRKDCGDATSQVLSQEFNDKLNDIIAYIPYLFHPDGTISLLGDSHTQRAEAVLKPLASLDPYVRYVYSNGTYGSIPARPSRAFNDAQVYVMRSGWGDERAYADESYLIADYGPYGNTHQQSDFMTFELSAGGFRWITDLGAFIYDYDDPRRLFIVSDRAHNVIVPYEPADSTAAQQSDQEIVAGRSEDTETDLPIPPRRDHQVLPEALRMFHAIPYVYRVIPSDITSSPTVHHWISEPDFDYLEGHFQYEARAGHSRAILFIKPCYVLVVDHLQTTTPLMMKQLFHMPPAVEVASAGTGFLLSANDTLHCAVVPILPTSLPTIRKVTKGHMAGELQGWYSGDLNNFEPAPVLEYLFKAEEGSSFLAHLFVPKHHGEPAEEYVTVVNGKEWDPWSGSPLELIIHAGGGTIRISYRPSAAFLSPGAGASRDKPFIEINR